MSNQVSKDKLHEIRSEILRIQRKLEEFHQYKLILQSEGMAADATDKERESKFIVQLTRAEKKLAALEGRKYVAPKRGQKRVKLVADLEEQNQKEVFFQNKRKAKTSSFRGKKGGSKK